MAWKHSRVEYILDIQSKIAFYILIWFLQQLFLSFVLLLAKQ